MAQTDSEGSFRCGVCGRRFESRRDLERHVEQAGILE
jgi:uncharacterized C2H2 Zn-finger protein